MAGPLSGLGAQQVPLSSPFQPGQGNAQPVRNNPEQKPEDNRVQPQKAAAAPSQRADSENKARAKTEDSGAFRAALSDGAEQRRGSLVDITV